MHYFDCAATTPVLPQVCRHIQQAMENNWANPSQSYAIGVEAQGLVLRSRKILAQVLGAEPAEVVFTASGTEANNLALWGAAEKARSWAQNMVATGYEHPSVQKPLEEISRRLGYRLTLVAPGGDGRVDVERLAREVDGKTALVAAMHANNETGAVIDVARLAAMVKEKNRRTAFHSDGVQAFCKLPLKLAKTQIDTYALSGHKIGAPKGIGALYVRKGFALPPLMQGGGQEGGLRPGTENTAYIAGLAEAARLMATPDSITPALHQSLLEGLKNLRGVQIHSPNDGIRGMINMSLPNIYGETMVNYLAQREIYCAVGSACSGKNPSRSLLAMGLSPQAARRALRISFNRFNTPQDIGALLLGLEEGLAGLQGI